MKIGNIQYNLDAVVNMTEKEFTEKMGKHDGSASLTYKKLKAEHKRLADNEAKKVQAQKDKEAQAKKDKEAHAEGVKRKAEKAKKANT